VAGSGKNMRSRGRYRKFDRNPDRFRAADWSQSTNRIAEQIGTAPHVVLWMRRMLAPQTCRPRGRPKGSRRPIGRSLLRYRSVDWTMKDREIAGKLGVSRQAVNVARHLLLSAKDQR